MILLRVKSMIHNKTTISLLSIFDYHLQYRMMKEVDLHLFLRSMHSLPSHTQHNLKIHFYQDQQTREIHRRHLKGKQILNLRLKIV